ncbi:hypothetical protein SODALDRAFT_380250 [Sodiomyces alkalinus F11]|uniref:Uncharacterized protein n=1 Tax=Sodiomyces alkalinus (strain CBS 110278 / VKM F-3762 / F11) TaxID=1314773 RepID=A0A3N2PQH5_SODAK|nr:hypothetical protein SODALDRAFT_380250 [Sodiomyces alkalinus F11]ROT36757.1 hypothetical protein SODALDRAFT_380250 [Sodiomyces alkalinus F11]
MYSYGLEPPTYQVTSHRGQHGSTRSLASESTPLTLRHQRRRSLLRHRHSHHHQSTHHRREWPHDDRAPASSGAAVQPGRHSLDVTRSELGSRYLNFSPHTGGRNNKPSFGIGSSKRKGNESTLLSPPGHIAMSRNSEEALRVEKDKAAARITGLGKSLADLSTFSNHTTRRLDEAHYAALEKTSVLQSTITAMKDLAILSRALQNDFEKESGEMVHEVQGQLEALGGFEEQEKRILELQDRIQAGRTKIHGLSERVDVVRRRVEGWEKADLEWRQRTRKRLRNVWIVISVVVAAIVLLLVGARYVPPGMEMPGLGVQDAALGEYVGEGNQSRLLDLDGIDGHVEERPGLPLWKERGAEGEDRLRFLDEL